MEKRLMMCSDQFWSRKQKSDSHDIHSWLASRNKIGIPSPARPLMSSCYSVFTSGQQFSYLTPPPSSKRTTTTTTSSPQDQPRLPYYHTRGPSPPHRDIKYFSPSPPQTAGNNLEDDSGFESLVTNVSDSGSVSSRLVMTSPSTFMTMEVSEPAYQNVLPATVR